MRQTWKLTVLRTSFYTKPVTRVLRSLTSVLSKWRITVIALSRFHVIVIGLSLFVAVGTIPGNAQSLKSGIRVELDGKNPLRLHVTLRSLAKTKITIYKSQLPWELRDSIILVAVRSNGLRLDQNVVAGDPSPEQISLKPNESVSGYINLSDVFQGLDDAVGKSDIQLFWAYRSPEGLGLDRWSGGWILIPKRNE
jgi:hypothetical protein